MGDSQVGLRFIQSLNRLPDNEITHAVVRFTFGSFENNHFAPDWWEGLTQHEKEMLGAKMRATADPTVEWDPERFKDDGLRIVTWMVRDRISNLPL